MLTVKIKYNDGTEEIYTRAKRVAQVYRFDNQLKRHVINYRIDFERNSLIGIIDMSVMIESRAVAWFTVSDES